jgi:PHD/YefM family antitoxin component YafN of YafNO toxin-antitoxin module
MKQYTLAEARERQEEIFELANLEPIVLVEASHPSHVVISFEIYQQLLERSSTENFHDRLKQAIV